MPETSQPLLSDENDEISLPKFLPSFQKSVEKSDEITLPMVFKSPMEKSDDVLENSMEKSDEQKDEIFLRCIMCNKQFNRLEIERHVNNCIDKVEKNPFIVTQSEMVVEDNNEDNEDIAENTYLDVLPADESSSVSSIERLKNLINNCRKPVTIEPCKINVRRSHAFQDYESDFLR